MSRRCERLFACPGDDGSFRSGDASTMLSAESRSRVCELRAFTGGLSMVSTAT
jgi:hypothetical protein